MVEGNVHCVGDFEPFFPCDLCMKQVWWGNAVTLLYVKSPRPMHAFHLSCIFEQELQFEVYNWFGKFIFHFYMKLFEDIV